MNTEFSTLFGYIHHVHATEATNASPGTATLVDFDANLFHKDLDFSSATQRAQEKGVQHFVVPGSTLKDSREAIAAAEQHSCVVAATAGVHPYNAESIVLNDENIFRLRKLLASQHCLAVGECGLDYSDGFPPPSLQMDWFRMQISLAIEFRKPLYLHIRNAYPCFAKLLEEETVGTLMNIAALKISECDRLQSLMEYFRTGNGQNIVVHCFTGCLEELQFYVGMGFFIGLTGHVFSLPLDTVQQMLKLIPLDKLVLETDAPYMGFKGCREGEDKAKSRKYPNVPAALPKIAAFIADMLDISYEEVCLKTSENALSFFKTKIKGGKSH